MKKFAGPAAVAIAIIAASLTANDGDRAFGAAHAIAPGDTLVYDITLDVQRHAFGTDSRTSMTSLASGSGTETLSIDRVALDGTAYAGLAISFRGTKDGRPLTVDRSWRAKLAPDGEIVSVGGHPQLGDDLDQALAYINGLSQGLPSRTLSAGTAWRTSEPLGSTSGSMIITSKVVGAKTYQGNNAYVIEQNGAGAFTQSVNGSPGVGSIAIGGTLYYDKADHVLIGGAARSQTELAIAHADIAHISATTSVNIRLRSWRRASASGPQASPSAGVQSPAAQDLSPTAAPSLAPSPAYTPAASTTSTPSPIGTGT
ncbi:MAG TPA: hypothetical protein VJN22_08300 [Candidatus Eremiobacteraceae bacterium]|nr:hypothetical protein [Candidatus Eremiobacteraceae bacterium]